jgi:putative ABC transport system permease protein
VIVSQTLAQRMFPNQDAVNRHVYWTDPVLQFFSGTDLEKARLIAPHRIIGVTADIDDEHVVPEPTLTVYSPFDEGPMFGGRLFIHTVQIPMRWSRRSRALFATCPPISRLSTPPLSKTFVQKCSRRTV